MICAIHQPNFFPWLGYFNKIHRSDVFVFMDAVAYPKSGNSMGSYTNRVKILSGEKATYIACPVQREHGQQIIQDTLIQNDNPWKESIITTLQHAYKRSPFYQELSDFVFSLIRYEENSIAAYNIHAIKAICEYIGLKHVNFIKQSTLNTQAHSTELLIEITKKVEADTYLCGGGAGGYQQDGLFAQEQIKLVYQDFKHPVYPQLSDSFVGGLSILDALFMVGPEAIRALVCAD